MGLRKKNFNITGVHYKIQVLREREGRGFTKKQYVKEELHKKCGFRQFADLRRNLVIKRGGAFEGG